MSKKIYNDFRPWIIMCYDYERLKTFRTSSPSQVLKDNPKAVILLLYYFELDGQAEQVLAMFRLLSRKQKFHLFNHDWVEVSKCPRKYFYGYNLLKHMHDGLPDLHIPVVANILDHNRRIKNET